MLGGGRDHLEEQGVGVTWDAFQVQPGGGTYARMKWELQSPDGNAGRSQA